MLVAASLGLLSSRSRLWARLSLLPGLISSFLLLVSFVFVLGYLSGSPMLYGRDTQPVAFLSAAAFFLLNLSLLLLQGDAVLARDASVSTPRSVPPNILSPSPGGPRPIDAVRLATILLGVGSVALTAGYFYLRSQQRQAREAAQDRLEAIASLKASQIVQWRNEKIGDLRVLLRTAGFETEALAVIRRPDPRNTERVRDRLEIVRRELSLDSAVLLDGAGRPVAAAGSASVPPSFIEAATRAPEAMVIENRLHQETATGAHIDTIVVFVPLRDAPTPAGKPEPPPDGFLMVKVDPHRELFPLVRSWPLSSLTAEAYVAEARGPEVLILSELRFRPDGSPSFRGRLDDPLLSAAAAARGETGIREGVDYRGVPVLSVTRKVPDSSWGLVVEMDQSEAYAPVSAEVWRTATLVALILISLALAGGLVWRHQQTEYLRLSLIAEHESRELAERLALVSQSANDAILLFDESTRIVEANDRVESLYRRSPAEMRTLSASDLRAGPDRANVEGLFRRIFEGETVVFEARHVRSDGQEFPVEVNSRPVTIAGRRYVLSAVRDITERKNQEREIQRLTRLYAALAHLNQSAAQATSRADLLRDACRSLVEAGGFRTAWIGVPTPEGWIQPAGVWGDDTGYVERLVISTSHGPQGSGPTGRAYREARAIVSRNFLDDPGTSEWHERARKAGFVSSASLPIAVQGKTSAVLSVYAAEVDYFRDAELALLEEAARDVAVGIERLDREAARERAEAETRAVRERLEATINAVPDLLFELSRDGRYLSFHSPRTELLAAPPEVFLGRSMAEILPPEAADACMVAIAEADQNGRSNGRQFRLDLPQGAAWFELSIAKAPGAEGEDVRFVALSRDITDRKRAEEVMLRNLREKGALLKEVHHRVKNNLQVITSLLRLEAARSRQEESRSVLRDMQSRIRSMALLHETLYQTGNFAGVNLADYLERLSGQLLRAQQRGATAAHLVTDLSPVNLGIDQAIPCGLIVNELLTNSLKHAFPGGAKGEVRIALRNLGERQVEIEVSDNGVGLPGDFEARRHASLGMQLVGDLARQLLGELSVGGGVGAGQGARFAVRFPVEDTASRFRGEAADSAAGPGPA